MPVRRECRAVMECSYQRKGIPKLLLAVPKDGPSMDTAEPGALARSSRARPAKRQSMSIDIQVSIKGTIAQYKR